MSLQFKIIKTKMSEQISSYEPEISPGQFGAQTLKDPQAEIADALIEHVEQGAVPLLSSLDTLDYENGTRVMNAILDNPDRIIGDSMAAQIDLSKYKSKKN